MTTIPMKTEMRAQRSRPTPFETAPGRGTRGCSLFSANDIRVCVHVTCPAATMATAGDAAWTLLW